MALFSQKDKVSCHPWAFNRPRTSTELYTSDLKKEGHNYKKKKTVSKITGLFSLYEKEAGKLHGQE